MPPAPARSRTGILGRSAREAVAVGGTGVGAAGTGVALGIAAVDTGLGPGTELAADGEEPFPRMAITTVTTERASTTAPASGNQRR